MAPNTRSLVSKRIHRLGALQRLDAGLAQRAARAGRREPWRTLSQVAELADQPPLLTISIAALLGGAAMRNSKLADTGKHMLSGFVLATLITKASKHLVSRSRPKALFANREITFTPNGPHDHQHQSFPSGHTSGGVALARAVARNYPRAGAAMMMFALSAGVFKVFKGDHYPSDVLAGLALGLASERATLRKLR